MSKGKFQTWFWVALVAVSLGLFAPAMLLATGADDDYEEYETFQSCFGTSQSDTHTN